MSYNQQGGNRPQRKLTILDDFRMRLVGPVANGGERPTTLVCTAKKNRPVIVVKTNIPGDKQFGQIQAEWPDAHSFDAFLDDLENADKIEPGKRIASRISDYPFQQGGRSKELKLSATAYVGREADGTVYIAVVSWDQSRATIKFPVRPSQFLNWIDQDGQPMNEAKASVRFARSYARTVRNIMTQVLIAEYEPPAPRPQNGGGGGGYGGGNGGGGYQNNRGNGGGGGGGYQGGNSGGGQSNSDAGLGGGDEWPI